MNVPWSLTVPAVTAGLAYLNARWFVADDVHLIKSIAKSLLSLNRADKQGRLNAYYMLEERALNPQSADHLFLIFEGQQWTYRQAYDLALKYGAWMKEEYDIRPNEIVAMDMTNTPTFLWVFFGIWSLGAKPAFINYNLTGDALCFCVKTSTARVLIVDDDVNSAVQGVPEQTMTSRDFLGSGKGSTNVVYVSAAVRDAVEQRAPVRQADNLRADSKRPDIAVLIFTSGTTGLPKPAIVSWMRFHRGVSFVASMIGLRPADRFYTCMPLYHSSAFTICTGACLSAGATVVLDRKFSNSTYWNTVRSSKATWLHYVGETCRYLLAATPSPQDKDHNLRGALGNGLRPDVWNKFTARFAIPTTVEFYAATEGPGSTWNVSRNALHAGAIGRSGPLTQLLLGGSTVVIAIDPADNETPLRDPTSKLCIPLPHGSIGECLNKLNEKDIGESYHGYFGNDKASQKKIIRDVLAKGDAYYRTGDLLRFDEDGHCYFIDRIGDTFRWKSENVSTTEVAGVLGAHEGVVEATVYGIELPGHDGRAGCAAIALEGFASPTPGLLRSLADYVQANLASYATPLFLRFPANGLQTTGTNKTIKTALRDEGVEPARVNKSAPGDRLYWLQRGQYVEFADKDWKRIVGGEVRL